MGYKFNPLSGNFDIVSSSSGSGMSGSGSGSGGGSAFFAGEVATYADLPLDGTAALDSRWLVRTNSGTWPFSSYKQAGVYVRSATVGANRDDDYTLTDTSFHDVMSDSAFVLFDDGDATKNLKFQLSGITTATTRTLTVPDEDGTITLNGVSSVAASASDVLGVSGSDITGVDAGSDKIVFWDDSASALKYLEVSTGLSLSGTTLTATASGATSQTDVFTANGTWTKPAGAKYIMAIVLGGGGGAGAGRRGATSTNRGGGGGGGAAGVVALLGDASFWGSTESVTVGAGGAGGANSADDTNGANGTAGGDSAIGSFITAKGGTAGSGGTTAAGNGGGSQNNMSLYFGTQAAAVAGGAGSVNGNAAQGGTSHLFPTGGGGGAGLDSSNNNYVGGRAIMGTSGAYAFIEVPPANPAATTNGAQAKWTLWGTGGAGTRSHPTNAPARGGDGAQGAGGGGGPAALNGSGGSTAGGSGGNGIVVITTYF